MIWSPQRSIEGPLCTVNRTASVRFRTHYRKYALALDERSAYPFLAAPERSDGRTIRKIARSLEDTLLEFVVQLADFLLRMFKGSRLDDLPCGLRYFSRSARSFDALMLRCYDAPTGYGGRGVIRCVLHLL
jgi:hypothetical protein